MLAGLAALLWLTFRKRTTSRPLFKLSYEALLIGWVGCYAAVTMTPSRSFDWSAPNYACDTLLREPVKHLFSIADRSLNVWIAVPAGIFMILAAHWRLGWILAGFVTPMVAEFWQLNVPGLGRQCSLLDIQDNYQGLLIGLAAGLVLLVMRCLVKFGYQRRRTASQR